MDEFPMLNFFVGFMFGFLMAFIIMLPMEDKR